MEFIDLIGPGTGFDMDASADTTASSHIKELPDDLQAELNLTRVESRCIQRTPAGNQRSVSSDSQRGTAPHLRGKPRSRARDVINRWR